MEWLVLRLHRKAVARFAPLTADLSDWIRLYRELLHRDKELSNQLKKMKAESREFNARMAEIRSNLDQYRADSSRLENSIPKMSKSVSDV